MEAGEPEERAAEEKVVEEKEGERKGERIGSLEKESKGDVVVVVVVVVIERGGGGEDVGFLKVERRWSGDLCSAAGDAIIVDTRISTAIIYLSSANIVVSSTVCNYFLFLFFLFFLR